MNVTIVGGGITGLATAWYLHHDHGIAASVLEAADHLGGKLRSGSLGDRTVDLGADSFLARDPEVADLARRVGLGDDLVTPASSGVSVWSRGRLHRLPGGTVLGVPTDVRALLGSGLFSAADVVRAARDLLPPHPRLGDDRSVGDVVAERLGAAVVDALVDPLLGGVYAGDPYRLSVRATTPIVAEAAAGGGSLVRALRRRRRDSPDGPLFQSIADGGMARLAAAVAADLPRGTVETGAAVAQVGSRSGRVEVGLRDGGSRVADRVVLALPAHAAAPVVEGLDADAAAALAAIPYASVATVAVTYPREAVANPLEGTGLLVPRREERTVKAVTYLSTKWAHHQRPDDVALRASVGRAGGDDLPDDDSLLMRMVHVDLVDLLGVVAAPVEWTVMRWDRALPQYEVGHLDHIASIRARLAGRGPVHLAGAAYDGVGVAACVAAARRTAAAIAATRAA